MKMFKAFKSFSQHSSMRPRRNDGRATRRSRDMQLKVKKLNLKKRFPNPAFRGGYKRFQK